MKTITAQSLKDEGRGTKCQVSGVECQVAGVRCQVRGATHLAMLEKPGANHRETLAALERQGARLNPVESGLARVDERTRKSSANCAN